MNVPNKRLYNVIDFKPTQLYWQSTLADNKKPPQEMRPISSRPVSSRPSGAPVQTQPP